MTSGSRTASGGPGGGVRRASALRAITVVAAAAAALGATSTGRADLLAAGGRTGTVMASATGVNTGPGPSPTAASSARVPATGAGTATTGTVYANPFYAGQGTPPAGSVGQVGTASAVVNLGQVSGATYALSAAATFAFATGTNSGQVAVAPTYTFDQKVVATQAEAFTLTMAVTRPQYASYPSSAGGSTGTLNVPVPGLSFAGDGVADTLSAGYPYQGPSGPVTTPLTVTQTYVGLLQPGTYSFDSTFTVPPIFFLSGVPSESDSAAVSATLSVSSVPEPATAGPLAAALVAAAGPRRHRRTCR